MKIYYTDKGRYYEFKFFHHGFLVLSEVKFLIRGGNKKKSKVFSISHSFLDSLLTTASIPLKKPDIDLWEIFDISSFSISEKILLRWINKQEGRLYWHALKELKNKIKDKQL